MSTKTIAEKVSPTGATTWSGYMEVSNNTGYPITWVAFEHCCKNASTATGLAASLDNNGDAGPVAFSTAQYQTDYWFISFIDQSGNLITGSLTEPFHSSSAGTTVEISLNPTSFTVTIGSSSDTSTYFQKNV